MIKYIDEFRNKKAAKYISEKIKKIGLKKEVNIMEICGGHTITIMKFGVKDLLPGNINLKSGPGCPVCVTGQEYIDKAIELSKDRNVIITSFGDMMRVPGSKGSLLNEKSKGSDVRIVLSPLDALNLAKNNPGKEIVFLGIGFETTAPTIAATIAAAGKMNINNFSVLASLKTMPEAMTALLSDKKIKIDAFICPGHVSVITGTQIYDTVAKEYGKPCVISGFEPTDMLNAIYMIIKQINEHRSEVEIEYTRAVKNEGNPVANKLLDEIFQASDVNWRGVGVIPGSGLSINNKYEKYDADKKFNIKIETVKENPGCICGEILKSIKTPDQCKLFKKICTPDNPVGACMVSAEGTCNTYYKYS